MHPFQMEQLLRNLDVRMTRVEQFLPTLATKHDLREEVAKLATKEDFRALKDDLGATKDDVRALKDDLSATKNDVRGLKDDVRGLKDDVRGLKDDVRELKDDVRGLKDDVAVIRVDLKTFVTREEFLASQADTRRHAVILTESVRDDIRLLAEHIAGMGSRNRE